MFMSHRLRGLELEGHIIQLVPDTASIKAAYNALAVLYPLCEFCSWGWSVLKGRYTVYSIALKKQRSQAPAEGGWDLLRGLSKNILSLGERDKTLIREKAGGWLLDQRFLIAMPCHIAVPWTDYRWVQDTNGRSSLTVFWTAIQKFIVVAMIYEHCLNGSVCKLLQFTYYFGPKNFRYGTCGQKVFCSRHIT